MARTRPETEPRPDELNLVPIMNLVVCLIPIVLLGTSLIQVGVVEVEAPRICAGCHATHDGPPLGLTVTVAHGGFELRAADRVTLLTALMDLLDPTIAEPEHVAIPRKGGALDFAGLYNALVLLKAERPAVTQVMVGADAGIPWREVVSTMDVARTRLAADHYDGPDALAAAATREGPPEDRLLFPSAMLTVAMR